jgi:hypothetical protein
MSVERGMINRIISYLFSWSYEGRGKDRESTPERLPRADLSISKGLEVQKALSLPRQGVHGSMRFLKD